MKVLVDSCVWSLALRRSPRAIKSTEETAAVQRLQMLLTDGRAAIIGPIRQEVLSGIKDAAQFQRIERVLSIVNNERLQDEDFIEAAKLFNYCMSKGTATSTIDILICAVAIRANWPVLTLDKGLLRAIKHLQLDFSISMM